MPTKHSKNHEIILFLKYKHIYQFPVNSSLARRSLTGVYFVVSYFFAFLVLFGDQIFNVILSFEFFIRDYSIIAMDIETEYTLDEPKMSHYFCTPFPYHKDV